jgi:hypothetical protein
MGTLVQLDVYRERRRAGAALDRIETAVRRLEPLVRVRRSATPTIERELRAVARAVATGAADEAADRAERLVGLLLHPTVSG